mgnify:CR=1
MQGGGEEIGSDPKQADGAKSTLKNLAIRKPGGWQPRREGRLEAGRPVQDGGASGLRGGRESYRK